MTFKQLNIGDTFDFVAPAPAFNSFYDTCVKIGPRKYRSLLRKEHADYSVGSVKCDVYHVNAISIENYESTTIEKN